MTQQRREYLIKFYDRKGKETGSFNVPAGTNFDIAVFSPDDKYLATDAPDNSVAVWELSSKRLVHRFSGPGTAVLSLTFAPDRKSLAATFMGGRFSVWDLNSPNPNFEEQSQHHRPTIAFSADGKYVAVGMQEKVVDLLDATTGKKLETLFFPKGSIGLMTFSPNGTRLVATTSNGDIFGWDIPNKRHFNFSEGHSNEVMSFSFSPDSKTLATGSVDRTVKLWDVDSGKLLRTIVGHGGWVTALHFSPDGRYLLSGDADGLIKLWDMATRELPVWPEEKPASISATAFTPENELIAIGRDSSDHLKLWNLSNGKTLLDL
ncbi:MAG TPA: WD40 repeat domain-containing protein, partial [Anaerolineales bacterium]|nr:WD40 repeat domain-containing protein [Anaerolineales bacterium]